MLSTLPHLATERACATKKHADSRLGLCCAGCAVQGRSGKTGIATTFINSRQCSESILLDLKHLLKEAKQRVPHFLMVSRRGPDSMHSGSLPSGTMGSSCVQIMAAAWLLAVLCFRYHSPFCLSLTCMGCHNSSLCRLCGVMFVWHRHCMTPWRRWRRWQLPAASRAAPIVEDWATVSQIVPSCAARAKHRSAARRITLDREALVERCSPAAVLAVVCCQTVACM